MVVRDPIGLKAALGENPKRVYGDQKKQPATRMASAALLRDAFVKANNYRGRLAQADSEGKPFDRDLRMEPLVAVLERRLPLRLHAHRADDILTALRIRDEFGFDLVLEHATEGTKVAAILAAGRRPGARRPDAGLAQQARGSRPLALHPGGADGGRGQGGDNHRSPDRADRAPLAAGDGSRARGDVACRRA